MPAWLLPVVKALGHLATIAAAISPAFTKRKANPSENQVELTQQQITELQTAASQTDAHVRELAAELKDALAAIEQGALAAEERIRRISRFAFGTACLALLSLAVSIVAYLTR